MAVEFVAGPELGDELRARIAALRSRSRAVAHDCTEYGGPGSAEFTDLEIV
ncbi:hypothetical protein ACIBSW_06410 [Actinoplanes sp. NPDC049668]|uniref:hypothetical protein n=1 Tax=unclassified Actinoplanes TaxID=2626549 RepID=UPI0033BD9550